MNLNTHADSISHSHGCKYHVPCDTAPLCRGIRPLVAVMAGLLLLLVVSPAAAAGESKVFDATLSLTGDCSVSTRDPIPDPGPCPGATGVDHPDAPFNNPHSVAVDSWGNIYVASTGPEQDLGIAGRIDVFDSSGNFITEIDNSAGPRSMAVDGEGHLYVGTISQSAEEALVRYDPTTYEPAQGVIEYGSPPVVLVKKEVDEEALAINIENGHLFWHHGAHIVEFGSVAEENSVVGKIGEGQLKEEHVGLAIDAAQSRIYAGSRRVTSGNVENVIKVFDLAAPHDLLFEIEESAFPGGQISASFLSLAADEGTGHLYVLDAGNAKKVYEFDQDGSYVSTIEYGFQPTFRSKIAVDNGAHSPNGALNPDGRYLFVPSNPSGVGHAYAFGPKVAPETPAVESVAVAGITEEEAVLRAKVNPKGSPATYRFEYVTQASFEAEGFATPTLIKEGVLNAGSVGITVSAPLAPLSPGTAYRFRVTAENPQGSDEEQAGFATYPSPAGSSGCPNEALRGGLSSALPDCRAYELVTPANTNGHAPIGGGRAGYYFPAVHSSSSGDAVSFHVEGGAIPGFPGASSLWGDAYLASRGGDGWTTRTAGPDGVEAPFAPASGSTSPDLGYSFWTQEARIYLRYPDGHSEPIGRGSLGIDPTVVGELISDGGAHVLFRSNPNVGPIQLEPDAPPNGTRAIYDRTIDPLSGEEKTHVVSLLPGEVTPASGEHAVFEGASLDGRGVAFQLGNTLYLRFENQETFEIGEGLTFAGVAEGGSRVFYLQGGDLYRFDAEDSVSTRFSEAGNVVPVNVAAEGGAAYFVSPSVLTGGQKNPNGAAAVPGGKNLYLSDEGQLTFVATVTQGDVEGEVVKTLQQGGLGLWVKAVRGTLVIDPSRTTPDGSVLVFQSRAALTGFDPSGHTQIYRYAASDGTLACLSCNPTGASGGDASLQSISVQIGEEEPLNEYDLAGNLRAGGDRVFFQSREALVARDVDGLLDVYEWEEEGLGTCRTPGGCVYPISSGASAYNDYLFATSEGGRDVFIRTADLLSPLDPDETTSIYDARSGGGFPPPPTPPAECLGEACQPPASPPADPTPRIQGVGNVASEPQRRCPKGKRASKRQGKTRCIPRHRKHRQHKANAKRRAHR